jgi:hypothetical protein
MREPRSPPKAAKGGPEADYKTNEASYMHDYAIRAQMRAAIETARQPKPKGT